MRYPDRSLPVSTDISVVIPCAGVGQRLRNQGPKAALYLGQETVVARQVRQVRTQWPYADIVAVVGFQAERVLKELPPGVRVVYNERFEETGVARSVALGALATNSPQVVFVLGDLVFPQQTLQGWPLGQSALLAESGNPDRGNEVGLLLDESRPQVSSLGYGLDIKWGQMGQLTGDELTGFLQLAMEPARQKAFCWEVLDDLIMDGCRFRPVAPGGLCLAEIDTTRQLDNARELVRKWG